MIWDLWSYEQVQSIFLLLCTWCAVWGGFGSFLAHLRPQRFTLSRITSMKFSRRKPIWSQLCISGCMRLGSSLSWARFLFIWASLPRFLSMSTLQYLLAGVLFAVHFALHLVHLPECTFSQLRKHLEVSQTWLFLFHQKEYFKYLYYFYRGSPNSIRIMKLSPTIKGCLPCIHF